MAEETGGDAAPLYRAGALAEENLAGVARFARAMRLLRALRVLVGALMRTVAQSLTWSPRQAVTPPAVSPPADSRDWAQPVPARFSR